MKKLGLHLQFSYVRKLRFKQVCPHRRNRDGTLVSSKECLTLWDDIDRTGVSCDLYKDATCFEEADSKENVTKFIELLKADPLLPGYAKDEIEFASVACTHWNTALAMAQEGKALEIEC